MSIFEIFTVKNTPTYVASKEVLEKLQEAKEITEEQKKSSENSKKETQEVKKTN